MTSGRHIALAMVMAIAPVVGRAQTPVAAAAQANGIDEGALGRVITLRLDGVTLEQAIHAVASKAGLEVVYSRADVPVDLMVSLVVDSITAGDAFRLLLRGTGIGVLASPGGRVTLGRTVGSGVEAVRRPQGQPGGGTIEGTVVDSATRATVPKAQVRVFETGQTAVSDPQGHYVIASVPPGEYHVSVRRLGFVTHSRGVVVTDGKVSTLDFMLSQPPNKLDEVVTTATGEQRRYQVGTSIATINVDSIAPTAPITSVTDVLTGRVPGLQIIETGGLTGSGQAIRIEGQSSMALQSDPIIIVDGVRQDNTAGGSQGTFGVMATPSRLNDMDPSQIETIDVLKGPAASTEYGTDAANGVIVITTKRGSSGKPQWHAAVEEGTNTIPTNYPDFYYSWGHLTDGSNTPTQCPLFPVYGGPASTAGTCAVDSVTHDNPLNHASTSIYGVGSRQKYDLDVSGGTETIRYFLAGNASNETSPLRLPSVFFPQAATQGLPSSAFKPNGETQRSGRANTFFQLGSTADLTVHAAYLTTYLSTPSPVTGLLAGIVQGGPLDSANGYGYGTSLGNPVAALSTTGFQQTDRFTGGLTANWRPAPWIAAFADAGIDHGTQTMQQTTWPSFGATFGETGNDAAYAISQAATDVYSGDLRVTATAPLGPAVRAVTTVGGNLRDTRQSGLSAYAYNLSTADLTLAGAPAVYGSQTGTRSATLGGYVEEQLQLLERLFLTGALRADGASGFGKNYQVATYPKVSASWLAVPRGPTTVRLRGAFGASGVQPYNGLTLLLYTPKAVITPGGPVTGEEVQQPGNPNLRPERTAEWEGGVDLGLWGNRVSVEFSGYQKTTTDALYNEALGWDFNNYTQEINIGEVTNNGLEGSITAIPVESRAVTWRITLNGSINHNKLVHLAPGLTPTTFGGYDLQQFKVGYPLYGFWGTNYQYADANHDGVLEPNEVTVDTGASYMGSSIPTQTAAFDTHVTLFHGLLSIGALFTYQGGYKVFDELAQQTDDYGTTKGLNVRDGASLADQARYLVEQSPAACCNAAGYFYDGTVFRFQELSLTSSLPASWARTVHVHSLTLTGAIRNLALWTRYPDGDPSASDPSTTSIPGTTTVNNDVRQSGTATVPLARYYQLRLNVGF